MKIRPISHRTLMLKSRNARNAEQFYKLANIDANKECQIWSDEGQLNHLEYSGSISLPEFTPPPKISLTGGLSNFIKTTLNECKP